MKNNQLIVRQNPKNKSWYVLGECLGYWMPLSEPMKSKAQAIRWAKGQGRADADAKGEVSGALSASNQIQ